jgi:hypothetical protein
MARAGPIRPALDGVEPGDVQLGELLSEYEQLRAASHGRGSGSTAC